MKVLKEKIIIGFVQSNIEFKKFPFHSFLEIRNKRNHIDLKRHSRHGARQPALALFNLTEMYKITLAYLLLNVGGDLVVY